MEHRGKHHLEPDERQDDGEAILELGEPVLRIRQEEVQRSEAQDGKDVGGIKDERIVGRDGEDGRYGVNGKQQVRELHHCHHHQQRRGDAHPIFPGEESVSVVVFRDAKQRMHCAGSGALGEVFFTVILGGGEPSLPTRHHQNQPKDRQQHVDF